MEDWITVITDEGEPLFNGNNIVVQHKHNHEIGYVENNAENRTVLGLEYPASDNEDETMYLSNASLLEDCRMDVRKWNHNLIKFLVQIRLGQEKEFINPKCKKNKLWQEIARQINQNFKTNFSGLECDNKYRNLIKTYKINKRKQNTSGEGSVTWEFFNTFDEILGTKASISPPPDTLMDTLNSEKFSEQTDGDTSNGNFMDQGLESTISLSGTVEKINEKKIKIPKKKNILPLSEYLFLKNQREKAREERRMTFDERKWEEEKEMRNKETDALLKLAEAISKKKLDI